MYNFTLDKEEIKQFNNWYKDHDCSYVNYSGAIGGNLTYSFTPTHLGMVVKVCCACGEEIDITDYRTW